MGISPCALDPKATHSFVSKDYIPFLDKMIEKLNEMLVVQLPNESCVEIYEVIEDCRIILQEQDMPMD